MKKRADPLASIPDADLRPKERPRALQYFSDEYLQRCQRLSPQDIALFLEEFRLNYAAAEAARERQGTTILPRGSSSAVFQGMA